MLEIFLPKISTGGDEKKDKAEWEAIAHSSSATQREQINLFEIYLSKLSAKTKEIDDKVQEIENLKININKVKDEANDSLKTTRNTQGLVFFGFFALVFVVIGIGYGYWQFIFTASKNEDYKYGLSEKINNNQNEMKNLKFCLGNNKWLNPKCFEN